MSIRPQGAVDKGSFGSLNPPEASQPPPFFQNANLVPHTELAPPRQRRVDTETLSIDNNLTRSYNSSILPTAPIKTSTYPPTAMREGTPAIDGDASDRKAVASATGLTIGKIRGRTRLSRQLSSASARGVAHTRHITRDRFIPNRKSSTAWTHSFHMSRPVNKLTPLERHLRHGGEAPDPFGARGENRGENEGGRTSHASSDQRNVNGVRSLSTGSTGVLSLRRGPDNYVNRQVSLGAVWNVGGAIQQTGPTRAIPNGRGGMIGSGTNAPMYMSRFLDCNTPDQDLDRYERRLAAALDFDQAGRIFEYGGPEPGARSFGPRSSRNLSAGCSAIARHRSTGSPGVVWRDSQWVYDESPTRPQKKTKRDDRSVPSTPFRVLDAPHLRDDFYCSLLAYTPTTHSLAVGLSDRVFIWSETEGVQPLTPTWFEPSYVTSLAFSSAEGGHAILAIGRVSGEVALWSLFEKEARFEAHQPSAIACLAWKPTVTMQSSERPEMSDALIPTEELLVGDEVGNVYYYVINWAEKSDTPWAGSLTLLARITVHTQQICGLAWSANGQYFATGGNDNACCLFEVASIITTPPAHETNLQNAANERFHVDAEGHRRHRVPLTPGLVRAVEAGREKHRWSHGAAVKAIAFCPWQGSLVATGGGSNDRCIHFYHTISGACLATISVAAQVTSLIWSTTRREIVATFGYAQPDHPYRIAVFSWPACRQIAAIPWAGEMRALYAIAYPGGPNQSTGKETTNHRGEGGTWTSRTMEEGCIVVAGSDESVKFHEVWSETKRGAVVGKGLLGGSDILESLEGIDKDAMETIR